MNNHGGEAAQKENEKSPESKMEHMEICDVKDTEFKTTVVQKYH